MFMVWSAVFLKTSSFRKSTIAALLVDKTFVVVYKLASLDRTIYTLYLVNRYGYVKEVHVTALMIIFLAFLTALAIRIHRPTITKRVLRAPRKVTRCLILLEDYSTCTHHT